jgi:hypothetical protein
MSKEMINDCGLCKFDNESCNGEVDSTGTCGMFDFKDNPMRPNEIVDNNPSPLEHLDRVLNMEADCGECKLDCLKCQDSISYENVKSALTDYNKQTEMLEVLVEKIDTSLAGYRCSHEDYHDIVVTPLEVINELTIIKSNITKVLEGKINEKI